MTVWTVLSVLPPPQLPNMGIPDQSRLSTPSRFIWLLAHDEGAATRRACSLLVGAAERLMLWTRTGSALRLGRELFPTALTSLLLRRLPAV